MLAQLDTKTVYTFMDSMVTIEEYVKRAKNLVIAGLHENPWCEIWDCGSSGWWRCWR